MLLQHLGGDHDGFMPQEIGTLSSILGKQALGQLLKPPAVLARRNCIPHLQHTGVMQHSQGCAPQNMSGHAQANLQVLWLLIITTGHKYNYVAHFGWARLEQLTTSTSSSCVPDMHKSTACIHT